MFSEICEKPDLVPRKALPAKNAKSRGPGQQNPSCWCLALEIKHVAKPIIQPQKMFGCGEKMDFKKIAQGSGTAEQCIFPDIFFSKS